MFNGALFAGYDWIPVLFLVAGLAFIIVEMLHPGFGAPGIIGIILLILGIVLYAKSLLQALIMIIILLAILGVALTLVLQSASKGRLARSLVLNDTLDSNIGYPAIDDMSYFLGSEGETITALRPSGVADFSGVKLDVVSDGEYIPKNTAVIITKIEGNRIIVRQKPK
ncbi:MAG: NfeD family protein [Bacillota bacterium]